MNENESKLSFNSSFYEELSDKLKSCFYDLITNSKQISEDSRKSIQEYMDKILDFVLELDRGETPIEKKVSDSGVLTNSDLPKVDIQSNSDENIQSQSNDNLLTSKDDSENNIDSSSLLSVASTGSEATNSTVSEENSSQISDLPLTTTPSIENNSELITSSPINDSVLAETKSTVESKPEENVKPVVTDEELLFKRGTQTEPRGILVSLNQYNKLTNSRTVQFENFVNDGFFESEEKSIEKVENNTQFATLVESKEKTSEELTKEAIQLYKEGKTEEAQKIMDKINSMNRVN